MKAKGSKRSAAGIVFLASTLIALLLAEFVLRMMGYTPDKGMNIPSFDCGKKQVVNDDYLGFKYLPGKYECSINGLNFSSTIGDDSFRVCTAENHSEDSISIHVYGCSITFGHALDDTATMAWKLQEQVPEAEIKNYGIGAGSTVQSYLVLKRNFEKGIHPKVVIINYASFHDQRNAMTWPWRKMWTSLLTDKRDSSDNSHVRIPYAAPDKEEGWRLNYITTNDLKPKIPFTHFSAVSNMLNEAIEKNVDKGVDEAEVSLQVLLSISGLCKANNAMLIVAGLTGDEATHAMLSRLKKGGILTVDISVDLKNDNYNLQPYDNHPNGRANTLYTRRLLNFLTNSGIIAERNK